MISSRPTPAVILVENMSLKISSLEKDATAAHFDENHENAKLLLDKLNARQWRRHLYWRWNVCDLTVERSHQNPMKTNSLSYNKSKFSDTLRSVPSISLRFPVWAKQYKSYWEKVCIEDKKYWRLDKMHLQKVEIITWRSKRKLLTFMEWRFSKTKNILPRKITWSYLVCFDCMNGWKAVQE